MLRLIKGGSIPTNYRFSISKHLMLRLILCSKGVGNCMQPNFKTSYVTVNQIDCRSSSRRLEHFKTSYVTVNLNISSLETFKNAYFKTSYVTVNLKFGQTNILKFGYFKTSYVTVNHVKVCVVFSPLNNFKTSYVTVNLPLFQLYYILSSLFQNILCYG